MYMWLSFCDPYLPKGTQFLGACIVKADNLNDAIFFSHIRRINPGGEVMGHAIPHDIDIPKEYINRLLSRADIKHFEIVMENQKL